MANKKNLVTFDKMTPERHRELSAKGGHNSRKAHNLAKYFEDKMNEEVTINGTTKKIGEVVANNTWAKAMKGDLKALELIAKILGALTIRQDLTTDGEKLDLTINLK